MQQLLLHGWLVHNMTLPSCTLLLHAGLHTYTEQLRGEGVCSQVVVKEDYLSANELAGECWPALSTSLPQVARCAVPHVVSCAGGCMAARHQNV